APRVTARFRVHYAANLVVRTTLYPGVRALVDELHQQGVALAVATNKPVAMAREILSILGLSDRFGAVVGEEEGLPKKPDRACVERICAALPRSRERALSVGDSLVDVATARAAGVAVAAVSWGYADRVALAAACPDHLVDDVAALGRLLIS